jgi:hypothetical protein
MKVRRGIIKLTEDDLQNLLSVVKTKSENKK